MRRRMTAVFTSILMLCGLILGHGIQAEAADNWGAFEVAVETEDTLVPGAEVLFNVSVTNVTEQELTTSWINCIYYHDATTDNSQPEDPESGTTFGVLKEGDTLISDGWQQTGKGVVFGAGQTRTFSLSGTIPAKWMDKSEILVVVGSTDNDCYGQGSSLKMDIPVIPDTTVYEEVFGNAGGGVSITGNDWNQSVFTEDEINSGEDRRVTLWADEILLNNLTPDELSEVQAKAAGKNIAAVFDIELYKGIGSAASIRITELASPIILTLTIPEAYRAADRDFAVIRLHDGAASVLEDLDSNPDTITISTDRFSYYTLAYSDRAAVTNPPQNTAGGETNAETGTSAPSSESAKPEIRAAAAQTGDLSDSGMYVWMCLASAAFIGYFVWRRKTA